MQNSRKQKKMQQLAQQKLAAEKNKKVVGGEPQKGKLWLDEEEARNPDIQVEMEETKDNLHFEDEFDDVFEEEIVANPDAEESNSEDYESVEDLDEQTPVGNQDMMMEEKGPKKYLLKDKSKPEQPETVTPYIGTGENLAGDEFLDFENRTYDMIHRSTAEWPCMTIDFVLPNQNTSALKNPTQFMSEWEYPIEAYAVSGSMASLPSKNQLYVFKFANLMKTKYDDDSDVSADEDEVLEDEPVIFHQAMPLKAGVNRIRSMHNSSIVAFWDEARKVQIFDLKKNMEYLMGVNKETPKYDLRPKGEGRLLKCFTNTDEGYGLEWSPHQQGRLITGASNGQIYQILQNDELCADFTRDETPYEYHGSSVEDINFSPTEPEVFASCGVDGTIQIVDMRVGDKKKSQLKIQAHENDVNVISWNKKTANLIASGGEDGAFKVFDIRFAKEEPLTNILWHTQPITSIEWQTGDEWSLAVSSMDNRVSIWDLSVEPDDDMKDENVNVPDQLMFVHQGQQDIKEIRWHPVYSEVLLTTASDGFNIFKPNMTEDVSAEEVDENTLDFIPDQIKPEELL